nr:MAG TPA: hypothetical protein [Caudoviricetes sp.]
MERRLAIHDTRIPVETITSPRVRTYHVQTLLYAIPH